MRKLVLALACPIPLAACGEDGPEKPYLEFAGGGFIFNYNIAEAHYGFIARVQRRIPDGVVLEAEFENPDGGDPIVVRENAMAGRAEYMFRTPPVQGVEAGRPYQVTLRLVRPDTGAVMASYGRTYTSSADQAILPKQPTTVGPGYQLNPDSELLYPKAGSSN